MVPDGKQVRIFMKIPKQSRFTYKREIGVVSVYKREIGVVWLALFWFLSHSGKHEGLTNLNYLNLETLDN